jgi:UDP-glucose 4-epimerase
MNQRKNILILGGFGFIGTNILKYIDKNLSNLYYCIVLDRIPQHPHGIEISCILKVYSGDFSDSQLIERIFSENKIDIVIHSLSTTIPVESQNARYDVESNLLPTIDVLNSMVKYQVKNIVYLSSGGAVYGNTPTKHSEDDNVSPISSYGVVKLGIEKYILQYAQLFGIQPLILRLSNPYGSYHFNRKQGVINVAIRKALSGETLQIWGDGNARKDYIYILDFVKILFTLLEHEQYCGVINIASGKTSSINEIVQEIKSANLHMPVEYTDTKQLDVTNFELDITKLLSIVGDFQFTNLREGINKTIEWSKSICD